MILSWNYDKGLLSFHEKTGDRLKELFIDICTSKKSPLINTCSLRRGLDAASATVSNTNNFSLCVGQDDQNDSPCSKGLSPQPSFNPSTLEELQNFIDESFQCLSSQKRNIMSSVQIIDTSTPSPAFVKNQASIEERFIKLKEDLEAKFADLSTKLAHQIKIAHRSKQDVCKLTNENLNLK